MQFSNTTNFIRTNIPCFITDKVDNYIGVCNTPDPEVWLKWSRSRIHERFTANLDLW